MLCLGINAPLMPVGHEFVQREMLKKFNMTDNDVCTLGLTPTLADDLCE